MKSLLPLLLLSAFAVSAAVNKPFPAHWGEPPKIQTMDIVPLPDGFGQGSSTLRGWINQNLQKDAQTGGAKPVAGGAVAPKPVYEQEFAKLPAGPLPDGEFLILAGEFTVAADGEAKFMELPGAPLDTFSVMFGPALAGTNATVSARMFGTTKSRRLPTFAVGLGGASPWKLVVAPGKGTVELWLDEQFKASAPWTWKSGTWTALKLEIVAVKEGAWEIRGKAWDNSSPEPADWTVKFSAEAPPRAGRASVWGSPFAGTPIRFDDLVVRGTPGK
jgi:hypothetical protein